MKQSRTPEKVAKSIAEGHGSPPQAEFGWRDHPFLEQTAWGSGLSCDTYAYDDENCICIST